MKATEKKLAIEKIAYGLTEFEVSELFRLIGQRKELAKAALRHEEGVDAFSLIQDYDKKLCAILNITQSPTP